MLTGETWPMFGQVFWQKKTAAATVSNCYDLEKRGEPAVDNGPERVRIPTDGRPNLRIYLFPQWA